MSRDAAWFASLEVGSPAKLGKNRWDKNKIDVIVVRIEIVAKKRVWHLSDGSRFPHSFGDANLHRSGQKRTWIGPCK